MKKIRILLVVCTALLLLIGASCERHVLADYSSDIKNVTANYYISDGISQPKSPVSRGIELAYTKLYVTPKKATNTVKGLSFKAKLADGAESVTFTVKAFITNPEKETSAQRDQIADYVLILEQSAVKLEAQEKEIAILFEAYTFEQDRFDNSANTYGLCIRFDCEGKLNETVLFSMNDFKFITE